ncbi:MAG TPA: PQQ-dependent sugar dehydrogenase [Dehalococcoidia bacterium]
MRTDPGIAVAAAVLAVTLLVVLVIIALSPWSGGSSADGVLQGDADCNDTVDSRDALAGLRFVAGAEPFAVCVEQAADVNCDGAVNGDDVLLILMFAAGLSPAQPASAACPAIGEPLGEQPTATPGSATASPATVTPTASPSATADVTPAAGGYHLETVVSSEALGAANGSVLELAMIPGAPTEAVAVRQNGQMYRVSLAGSFAPQAWGDISGIVDDSGNEEGLLSLAFSPGFAQDGRLYLYYTAAGPDRSVLARYTATAVALDGVSGEVFLSIPQFAANHNGGHIAFDHDGYLLLSTGDGGGGGDPNDNGQALDTLLGKVLRIDVSPAEGYAIPAGNPFADGAGGNADEIFAYGLRNPWRMTVDRLSGDVWLGDVGQSVWEEVDRVVIGGNYGWDCYEGFAEYEIPGEPDQCSGKVFSPPRAVYHHDLGVAVTGGFVYRGSAMPELYGWYIYGDFYSGRIWAVNTLDNSAPVLLTQEQVNIASFTELPDGELLIVSYAQGIFQLARD